MVQDLRSRWVRARTGIAGVVALLSLGAGCASDEHEGEVIADPVAVGLMPANWLGLELGVAQPTFVDRGKVKVTTEDISNRSGTSAPTARSTPTPFVQGDELAFDVTDYDKERHYEVTLPANIEMVAGARAQRQTAMQASGVPRVVGLMTKAVAGVDTRALMTIDGYAEDSFASAIGELGPYGGCTGTMISSNAYLTAAHCIVDVDGTRVKRDIRPRMSLPLVPWGSYTATQAVVPQDFIKNRCYEDPDHYMPQCAQYDIAFVRVVQGDEAIAGNTWFFRPAAETKAELLTRTLQNAGYPMCDKEDHPEPCQKRNLYGDQLPCELGMEMYGDPASLYRPVVSHSCDTNKGHSGSPIFYFDASNRPVMIGVHVAGNAGAGSTPNSFKRISLNTLNWIYGLL